MRWLWTSRRLDARLARLALLPAAGLWRLTTAVRDVAAPRGSSQSRSVIPAIDFANLTVGDSGKGPVVAWAARHLAATGAEPGVLLRRDSSWARAAFEHAVPAARVTSAAAADEGIARLANAGARVALVETATPGGDSSARLRVAVLGAESTRAVRWPLPAGPWRAPWSALQDVDFVVITRRRAPREAADELAQRVAATTSARVAIAHLGVRHFESLVSRVEQPAAALAGRRVVAASGSADPGAFVSQVKATGAAVQVATWEAQGELRDEDVAWLAHAARRADYVVISELDAVKLRDRWPARVAEPLVAIIDLTWECGGEALAAALDAVVAPAVAG
ncbi:MAG TPA: tetraacyldisaccharide 4'-kinase [Gemmatimonadales bacterium]|nr:tetraacyldisaccharide 4'-kinase [Gemmatimonadales bacterium]